jgi:hypothetical protein
MSKVLTLRRLEPGDEIKKGYFTLNEIYNPDALTADNMQETYYRIVNPIPEGYEVCDLEHATKILIGETWCERSGSYFILNDAACPPSTIACLGVLAIRPIPEPVQPPLTGEAKVFPFKETESYFGWVKVPKDLIGQTVKYEVVKETSND